MTIDFREFGILLSVGINVFSTERKYKYGKDGKIIARKGGIRRYIQSEIPDLYKSYKTLMRYKALARRFRQAVGISDPTPAASVLPEEESEPDAHECHDRKADDVIVGMSNKSKNTSVDAQKNIRNPQSVGMETVENMLRTNSHGGEDERAESGRRNEDGGGGEGGIWNRGGFESPVQHKPLIISFPVRSSWLRKSDF